MKNNQPLIHILNYLNFTEDQMKVTLSYIDNQRLA